MQNPTSRIPLVRAAVKQAVKIASSCYNNLILIEEKKIQPTNDQAGACVRVCHKLSNCYRDIQIFRYNPQEQYIFILAGDNLQV